MRSLNSPKLVFWAALALGLLAVVRLLVVFDWDPTVFTAFGEESREIAEYGREKLGRDVILRPQAGHDGQSFFVQANDPWILDPANNAAILGRPEYRSRRMLYPALAGGGGFFPPNVIIWALPMLNVIMLAAGSWAVASIARKHGAPAWVGIAFVLNIGLLSELYIDGAGIVAFALACIGAWALEQDRTLVAALAFVGSALTREVMVIFIAFMALFWLIRERVIPWAVTLPAATAIILWAGYVRLRLLPPDANTVSELTLIPFSGVLDALTSGRATKLDYLVIAVFVLLIVLVPYRAWKSDVYLTWGVVGFAILGPFLTVFVWQKSFNISRALAPLLTVFVLELFLSRRRDQLNESPERTGVRS